VQSDDWNHYLQLWGEPSRVAEFRRTDQPLVRVGKWPSESDGRGVTLYATDGVSVGLDGARHGHGYEVFVGLSPAEDRCASALAALATTAREKGIGPAHTMEAEGGLWPGSPMTGWLLAAQVEEVLPPVEFDSVHIIFLQALPLYPQERTWKAVHGTDALLMRWREQQVPFWDPHRAPSRLHEHNP
jgi:hypothetical protein